MTVVDIVTDDERCGYRAGSRFVGPDEWLRGMPLNGVAPRRVDPGARRCGGLLNFRPERFYAGSLSDVLRNEDDPETWRLGYDRFTAMVVMDAKIRLVELGLLATRGNGDSVDYRLTLPPGVGGEG